MAPSARSSPTDGASPRGGAARPRVARGALLRAAPRAVLGLALLVAGASASPHAAVASPEEPPAAHSGEQILLNGSFDDGPSGTGPAPAGWEITDGATNGDAGQTSEVALDTATKRHGSASLRLAGGAGTSSWKLVRQKVAVTPGHRVTLTAAVKSLRVRKEGTQFPNANAILEFTDAAGQRVHILWSPTVLGDRDWADVRVSALVPQNATHVQVGVFLSQSGTLWWDDVRVSETVCSLDAPPGRAAAFAALEDHLRATYPFFGHARKPLPEALFPVWKDRLAGAKDADQFVALLRQMLAELDDLHVWVNRGGKALPTAVAKNVRPNVDPAAVRATLTEVTDDRGPILAGRIGTGPDAVGYVAIGTWQMDDATAARLEAALDALADCRGLVLDVRTNAGGDETIAQRIASRFAADDTVYARSAYRDPLAPRDPAAFLAPQPRVLAKRKGAPADKRRVAVLQGRWCMSSCEGFLLMARALPTVTTFGERTRGASANPKPFPLAPDVTLWASTWRALPPEGDTIEGRGLDPETEVAFDAKAAKGGAAGADTVLGAALRWIRE